jgi:hypothetical protein
VVLNANPASSRSWGCFLVFYGQYMRALPPEMVRHLPGNQSCYRRELLLEYGPRLADVLQAEIVLHHELLANGKSLCQEPAAKVRHLNYSRIGLAMREYCLASRVFAAERRRRWSQLRRTIYAAGSILLPFIRLKRILTEALQAGLKARVLAGACGPALLILCAGAAGEMLGYALGPGLAKESLMRFEAEGDRGFTRQDLEAIVPRI